MKSLFHAISLFAATLFVLGMFGCGGAQPEAETPAEPAAEPAATEPAAEPAAEEAPKELEKFEGDQMERAEEDE